MYSLSYLEPVSVPCPVLTVVSCLPTGFSRSRSSGLVFPSLEEFSSVCTVKGFSIVNEAEVDVFLKFSCFFYDPVNVGNLISGFS